MANSLKLTIKDENDSPLAGVAVDCKNLADDVSVTGADNTDVNGQNSFTDLVADKEYYITASKSGYDSLIKAGKYHERKLIFKHMADGDDHEITTMMSTVRSRTQVNVYEKLGLTSVDPQVPIAGATVLIKKVSDNNTVETLTTNDDGVALMKDSLYISLNNIYAVVSKTGYNTSTVYFGTSNIGDVISTKLSPSVAFTTYTLSGKFINADGSPVSPRKVKIRSTGLFSIDDGGNEHYVPNSQEIVTMSDSDGKFEFTLVEGLEVQPVGWAKYFGYPDAIKWRMSANVKLGDGTAGKL